MPFPQLAVNSVPILLGMMGKYCYFRKTGFARDYLAGVWEGICTARKTKKVPCKKENLVNYLSIQWELMYGAALYIYEFSRRQLKKKHRNQ